MRRIVTALRRKVAALWPRRPVLVPVPVRRPAAQRGLTLVEMLITVAITLIMMAAVVNVFASIGQGVQHRRATIEVSNQLRIARTLLAQDLARATATTLPPRDPSSGEGYIELIEGIQTDWYPTRLTDGNPPDPNTGNFEIGPADPSAVPPGALASDSDILVQSGPLYSELGLSGLGDFDDVLALTVRSQGEPFVGRFGTTTIKSYEAEIIWYAVENPAPPSPDHRLNMGEPGMRTLYRRVLLIAPWVNSVEENGQTVLANQITALNSQLSNQGLPALPHVDNGGPETLRRFYRHFDVSTRRDPETGTWVANTLSDLTKRENRFAHLETFPHTMDVRRIRHTDPAVYDSSASAADRSRTPLVPFGTAMEFDVIERPDPSIDLPESQNRRGEDVVLTNVLGFDLRVFDPGAAVTAQVTGGNFVSGTVVEPGDVGRLVFPPSKSPSNIVGRGAYVDLAYLGDPTLPGYGSSSDFSSQYSGPPSGRAGFDFGGGGAFVPQNHERFAIRATYDTWSYHYEYDGIDQDRDDLVDQGTNGVDDGPKVGGIDDISERETLPPYLDPLRGMEVKLRIYEPDSRVVREVSVKQNFTPQ